MTSWVGRFILKLKRNLINTGPIQTSEMVYSEKLLIAHIQSLHYSSLLESIKESKPSNLKAQLGVYIDEDGLLRCHGRLGNSDLDETAKQPLLLPKADRFTELLIDNIHKKNVAFWCGANISPDSQRVLDTIRKISCSEDTAMLYSL